MSKQITPPSGQFLIVEVPEDATKFVIVDYDDLNIVYDMPDGNRGFVVIPPGEWSLIGKGDEIGEEVAKGIVEYRYEYRDKILICKDYVTGDTFDTATASLSSLITSHGFKNLVILKKKI